MRYDIFMEEKVFIFISHSHRDLDKVRRVRNFLEKNFSEPILFFLKSKDDEDEITSLIEEEIDARIWFIYCDSENARESNWVQKELDYVYKTGKRNCTTINLDTDFDSKGYLKASTKRRLKRELEKFLYLQRLTISCSHRDDAEIEKIRKILFKYGIATTIDKGLHAGDNWFDQSHKRIERASAVIFFFSENSLNSLAFRHEMQQAKEIHKDVFGVYLSYGMPICMEKQLDFIIDVSNEKSLEKDAVGLVYYLFDHI